MLLKVLRFCVLLLVAIYASYSDAAVVLQVGSSQQIADGLSVEAGGTLEIEIWASAAFSGSDLAGYRLAFDLDSEGFGHTSNFSSMGASFAGGILPTGSTVYGNASAMVGHDLIVQASAFDPVPFPRTPVKMFSVLIDVAANADPGVYAFNWRSNSVARYNGNGANILTGEGVSGNQITATGLTSFRVTAVPEPSSFAVLGIGAALLTARRNHKRRKQQMVTLE